MGERPSINDYDWKDFTCVEEFEYWRKNAIAQLEAKVNQQKHRTLKKLKEPGKLSVRVREGWGFGGESFLADEIEMLEDEKEQLIRAWYECPQDSVPDILDDVFQDIELKKALGGE